jgi:hypothetical protein
LPTAPKRLFRCSLPHGFELCFRAPRAWGRRHATPPTLARQGVRRRAARPATQPMPIVRFCHRACVTIAHRQFIQSGLCAIVRQGRYRPEQYKPATGLLRCLRIGIE